MTDHYMAIHQKNVQAEPLTLAAGVQAEASASAKAQLSDIASILPQLATDLNMTPKDAASFSTAFAKSKAFLIAA